MFTAVISNVFNIFETQKSIILYPVANQRVRKSQKVSKHD